MGSTKIDNRSRRGARAESLVGKHYLGLGYRILDRNWSCRGGELDLVVAKDGVVVFVEVRSVTTSFLSGPELSVTPAKQARVAVAAELWLGQYAGAEGDIRFDVVTVRFRPLLSARIERFEDAFSVPWGI